MKGISIFAGAGLVGLLFTVCHVEAGLFSKKEDKDEKNGKLLADLGLDGLQEAARDPAAFRELMELASDPQLMKQAEALMQDPAFRQEAERLLKSEKVQRSMKVAEEMAKDPVKRRKLEEGIKELLDGPKQGAKPRYTGQQSARMGMDTLAATVRDPTALKQTMDMLNDPSTRREVEAMMRDPSFRAEMERITSSPVFKQAMAQAQDLTAELQNDPKKLQAFMKEVEGAMGSFRGEL